MDNELFRNGSGYADITAYKAIKNIQRGENDMEIYRGDIFEYEVKGVIKKALVVSSDLRNKSNRYLSVIVLTDEPKGDVNVSIVCKDGTYYADCGMVAFAQTERFVSFLKMATDTEMQQIDEGIAKCLGLEQKVVEVPVEKIVKEETPRFDMWDEYDKLQKENTSIKAKAEVFEKLYKDLLADVMK